MILLDAVTWTVICQLFVVTAVPTAACLIGYLTYIRGSFKLKAEELKAKKEEQDQNRDMFLDMVVEKKISKHIVALQEIVEHLSNRVDDIYKLLVK